MNHYVETIRIRTKDCDMNGTWRFSAILEEMQEAAGIHSTLLGCGRDQLLPRGVVWVLIRSEVRMDRYPAAGEEVTVETFHREARHGLFPRYFIMTDAEGNRIGAASTIWMLMNLKTRESASADSVGVNLPDNRDMTPPIPLPAPIRPLQGEARQAAYRAVYTDLDVNGHVNNTKYADWICNQLGEQVLTAQEIGRMILDYNAEVLPEQDVRFELTREGDSCRMTGWCGEKKSFEIGCTLRAREGAGGRG